MFENMIERVVTYICGFSCRTLRRSVRRMGGGSDSCVHVGNAIEHDGIVINVVFGKFCMPVRQSTGCLASRQLIRSNIAAGN